MNRLVRIALTLFASATVLIFLVLQRLKQAKEAGLSSGNGDLGQFAHSEIQMVYIGMGIVALMLIIGISLIITAIVRSRKGSVGNG